MTTFDLVYEKVKQIPLGKVTTYGEIARVIGISNPRVVGYALHANKQFIKVPCHRVVAKDGGLAKAFAFGGDDIQKQLLENEGVEFVDNKVNMEKCFYSFKQIWK